jgi:hypothetical protein
VLVVVALFSGNTIAWIVQTPAEAITQPTTAKLGDPRM